MTWAGSLARNNGLSSMQVLLYCVLAWGLAYMIPGHTDHHAVTKAQHVQGYVRSTTRFRQMPGLLCGARELKAGLSARRDQVPKYYVDGGEIGGVSRYINHSCDPNLYVQVKPQSSLYF